MKCVVPMLVAYVTLSYSQQLPHLEFSLWLSDENSRNIFLRCGVVPDATEGIDPHLGEYALPTHPPNGFHAAWEVITDGIADLSYVDFRPYPDHFPTPFSLEYMLSVTPKFNRGEHVIIRWNYPLPPGIDSVVLSDRLDGSIVTLRFDDRRIHTMSGPAAGLERFRLRVFYNPSRASSVDKSNEEVISVNGDLIHLPWHVAPQVAYLYTLDGRKTELEILNDSHAIHCRGLEQLSAGWYMIVYRTASGIIRIHCIRKS